MSEMDDMDEEDYFLPPEQQRPFTSGVRRKRVKFVRSSDLDTTTTPASSATSGASIADTYLSIVMKQPTPKTSPSTPTPREQSPPPRTTQSAPPPTEATFPPPAEEPEAELQPTKTSQPDTHCEICNLPLATIQTDQPHEASLAHQVCLTHSHPPSHLDRTRQGLRYLSTYGWDPDSRRGLGAPGREGIREPLKPRPKNDTAGLGTGLDADGDRLPPKPPPLPKVQKLNAKQTAKKAAEDRARGERMRKLLFSNDEVLKYLGEGA
ncbi:hypothetical protein N7499_009373 [Penicillium canescens]|nr:hypothetical protein N7522_001728 [Penicillium canescens]KAJ6071359.1 hypothetical protein N7499_009373 [Penicillium canescens]KAJ6170038.1 hypothetical protein N7485_007384 [Penicillium canescens]